MKGLLKLMNLLKLEIGYVNVEKLSEMSDLSKFEVLLKLKKICQYLEINQN